MKLVVESKNRMNEDIDDIDAYNNWVEWLHTASIEELLEEYYLVRSQNKFGSHREEIKALSQEIKSRIK